MAEMNLEKYKTLAERYTNALLQTAKEADSVETIGKNLSDVAEIFSLNSDIENFFTSPIIKKEDKKEIFDKFFKGKIDDKFYNFLNILVDKNRIFILSAIENLYHKRLKQEANILEVQAQSVIELDEDMKNALVEKLAKITGKNIELSPAINKELIGGVVLTFDGQTIDGSVKTQLAEIQKQLI